MPYSASGSFGGDGPRVAGSVRCDLHCVSTEGTSHGVSSELIKAIGAGAAALPTITDATALAQETVSPPIDAATAIGAGSAGQAKTQAFLAQFETAWRPLDPQLRFVLGLIYAGLQEVPPPDQLSPTELRRINDGVSFYFNAGAPAT